MSDYNEFTLTDEHLALLRRMNVQWAGSDEFGSPCVDRKRPYGNGDVVGDMAKILGVQEVATDDDTQTHWPPGTTERMTALHRQTEVALDVVLSTGSFVAGDYVRKQYGEPWRLVEDAQ